jgi:DNA-binding response OmpR family regulator
MFVRSREAVRRRPHVVIAHSDLAYTAGVVRAFRRHGWEVAPAVTGQAARRLASSLEADLVVLQADLPDESGWLTCAKLNVGGDRHNVVLVSEEDGVRDEQYAQVAGAVRLVTREQGAEPLLEEAGLARPVSQVV